MSSERVLLEPTAKQSVTSETEAQSIIEQCLSGKLNHAPRGPFKNNKAAVMVPGHVYVYEKMATGIDSWQDGEEWTQDNISGKLVYWVPRSGKVGKMTYTHERYGRDHHLVAYHHLAGMGLAKLHQEAGRV